MSSVPRIAPAAADRVEPSRLARLGAALGRSARPAKVAVAGAAALAVGAGAWAYTSGASAAEYRTVEAVRGTVVGGIELTGTVTASGRADLSFAGSGTVSTVLVAEGDEVAKGEVIARLDRTALKRSLTKAQAALDQARATLASDLEAQASGVLTSRSTTTSGAGTGNAPTAADAADSSRTVDLDVADADAAQDAGATTVNALHVASSPAASPAASPGTSGTSTTHALATPVAAASSTAPSSTVAEAMTAVKSAQQAVLSSQTSASDALATAKAALAHQQQICTEDVTGTGCADALAAVQEAQSTVAQAQDALQTAITSLTDALDTAVSAVQKDAGAGQAGEEQPGGGSSGSGQAGSGDVGSGQSGQAGAGKPSSGSTPQPGAGGASPGAGTTPRAGSAASGKPGNQSEAGKGATGQAGSGEAGAGQAGGGQRVTAATIAADQAAVDKALAALLEARSSYADAALTAPVSGVVRALDIAVGSEVGTSDVVAVVVSDDVTAVDAAVEVTEVGALAVDQEVEVTLAGRSEVVAGSVASVAAAPSAGTTTYAVRVLVEDPEMVKEGADGTPAGSQAPLGSTAAMTVVTDTVEDVVSVPLSALSSVQSGTGTLRVLDGGEAEARRVTLGTVGATHVAVTDGLEDSEIVVLAEIGDDEIEGAAGEVQTSRRGGGFRVGGKPGDTNGLPRDMSGNGRGDR